MVELPDGTIQETWFRQDGRIKYGDALTNSIQVVERVKVMQSISIVSKKVYSIYFGSFFSYHVKTALNGISLITLTWFPHGSKKDCQQKWNKP